MACGCARRRSSVIPVASIRPVTTVLNTATVSFGQRHRCLKTVWIASGTADAPATMVDVGYSLPVSASSSLNTSIVQGFVSPEVTDDRDCIGIESSDGQSAPRRGENPAHRVGLPDLVATCATTLTCLSPVNFDGPRAFACTRSTAFRASAGNASGRCILRLLFDFVKDNGGICAEGGRDGNRHSYKK